MPRKKTEIPAEQETNETMDLNSQEPEETVTPEAQPEQAAELPAADALPESTLEADTPPVDTQTEPEQKGEAVMEQETPPTEEELPEPPASRTAAQRSFYTLDFNEVDRGLSPEQRQEWNSIYASYRSRSVMRGVVVGADPLNFRVRDKETGEIKQRRLRCAVVIPFRVRILIPETEMWMEGEERPDFVLRNITGAEIDFVVTHVDREGEFVVASRKQALASQRFYFGSHGNLNRSGARTQCDVLAVGNRRCLVSCHGYDINLTQRELSYTAIPDLQQVYHTGQTLPCVVKSFDRTAQKLTISVKESVVNPFDGAEIRHPVGCSRQAVIAGKYGGGVFCNLPDGVTVMCSYSFQYDDATFRSGDRVIVVIQRYATEQKQIYGKIVAKN